MSEDQTAYQMGREAYEHGYRYVPAQSCWANPFKPETSDHDAWNDGLRDATNEAEGDT